MSNNAFMVSTSLLIVLPCTGAVHAAQCRASTVRYPVGRVSTDVCGNTEPRTAPALPWLLPVKTAETSCASNSSAWHGEEQAWINVFETLESLEICNRDEIAARHHLRESQGFPIYRSEFEEHRDRLFGFFTRFDNLQCAGATGTFTMTTPDHAMRMGADAADRLLAIARI